MAYHTKAFRYSKDITDHITIVIKQQRASRVRNVKVSKHDKTQKLRPRRCTVLRRPSPLPQWARHMLRIHISKGHELNDFTFEAEWIQYIHMLNIPTHLTDTTTIVNIIFPISDCKLFVSTWISCEGQTSFLRHSSSYCTRLYWK